MPYLPTANPMTDEGGLATPNWLRFFQDLLTGVTRSFALANQPTLGSRDAGNIGLVSDYGHMVRWTGSVWEFAPGDPGSGYVVAFAVAPQGVGWGLCNLSTYAYLVVGGASLTTANFTTDNSGNYFRR